MNLTNFNLRTLENIFKINWVIGLVVYLSPFLVIPLYILNLIDAPFVSADIFESNLPIYTILLFVIILLIFILFFISYFIIKIRSKVSISILSIYFFIFLFFYFSYTENIFNKFRDSGYEFRIDKTALLHFIVSIVGSILFYIANRKLLKNVDNINLIIFTAIFSYQVLNLGGILKIIKFDYPNACLYIIITFFYIILFKFGQEFILKNFGYFIVFNVIFLIVPFLVCFVYKISFYDMSYLWSIKYYSDFSGDIVEIFYSNMIQYLILCSPYQLIIFPLYFCFNSFIIAKKIKEIKLNENNMNLKFNEL